MVKKSAIVFAVFIFFSCASTKSATAVPEASAMSDNFLLTLPRPGALSIIGVSGRLQKPEGEIDAAREDAARKAAMYHGINASYESIHTVGSGIFDYEDESSLTLEYDKELGQYMDRLAFDPNRDLVIRDRTVFIRFTYPASFPGSISYMSAKNRDGRPDWIDSRPNTISGYAAGVGFSARQFRRQDTFVKSYESALIEILSQLSSNVTSKTTSDGRWSNTSTITTQSIGTLVNFLILEIWVDPATQAVWTLAIARNSGIILN